MTEKAHDPLLANPLLANPLVAKGGLDLLELTSNRPAQAGIGSIRKSASTEWLALFVVSL
jgi:hypothetical protein